MSNPVEITDVGPCLGNTTNVDNAVHGSQRGRGPVHLQHNWNVNDAVSETSPRERGSVLGKRRVSLIFPKIKLTRS